ncbi:zymogen granule protein 16 homolog B [Choloepus didactylus]|uniref:zymogen granule protein 16 homolog B n=1 Tax=Choloepus didactylus TaxID=27675 RepID=UPI0018A057D6|nr:zymogen granule protein 16 homolog B [Choloepus didactylus]
MLLLLTLAVLGSPVCWAQQMYGIGGGTYFSTSEDNQNNVTGIRVCTGLGLIKSVQLRFGSSWTDKYGVPCKRSQEFLLRQDEHFVAAYGAYGLFLRYLELHTDFGRTAMFGTAIGQTFSASPSQEGQVLTGLFGQYKLLGISGLGFRWQYPLE